MRRQSVLHDPAARDERHPAVDDELLVQGEDEHDRERPEDDDEEPVLLEKGGDSAALLPARVSVACSLLIFRIEYQSRRSGERKRARGSAPIGGFGRKRRTPGISRRLSERLAPPIRRGAGSFQPPP